MELLPNSCRICLKACLKLTSLYSTEEYEETPRQMLFNITGMCLENEEELCELPKQICRNCICELNLAYQFRRKALEAQTFIEDHYKGLTKDTTCKTRINQFDFPNEAEMFDKEQQTHDGTAETVELVETNLVGDYEPSNSSENNITARMGGQKSTNQPFLRCQLKSKEVLNSNVKLSGRPLSKRGRKPKTIADQQTAFICDICGNVFSKRSRLTEHRHRHATEMRYSCELCGERFLLREMLRRHMYQHVGEKPFKCDYCSRTFYYESVKRTHEAVHKGHKPFVCKKCDKAFAYPHSLKKHELIHEDIKLYHCTYCNKEFRLPHHMKQHENTRLHRNAVYADKKMNSNKL